MSRDDKDFQLELETAEINGNTRDEPKRQRLLAKPEIPASPSVELDRNFGHCGWENVAAELKISFLNWNDAWRVQTQTKQTRRKKTDSK